MARLFQQFILNFARRKCSGASVRSICIEWIAKPESEAARTVLPRMITDVILEWPDRKIILDCKYYRKALAENANRLRLHSAHLYQLYAYMSNQAARPGWEVCEGILLYPTAAYSIDYRYDLGGHPTRLVTVDFAQDWPLIEADLVKILRGVKRSSTIENPNC